MSPTGRFGEGVRWQGGQGKMPRRCGVFSASSRSCDIIEQRQYVAFDSSVHANKAKLRCHVSPMFFLGL